MFRNERKLYRRVCDFSGKEIISIYSPDKTYKVYDQKIRWSDQWDPIDYGRDFDFTKSFTEQFDELMHQVPQVSLYVANNENSDYANYATLCKNCYLTNACRDCQDCMYLTSSNSGCKDIID